MEKSNKRVTPNSNHRSNIHVVLLTILVTSITIVSLIKFMPTTLSFTSTPCSHASHKHQNQYFNRSINLFEEDIGSHSISNITTSSTWSSSSKVFPGIKVSMLKRAENTTSPTPTPPETHSETSIPETTPEETSSEDKTTETSVEPPTTSKPPPTTTERETTDSFEPTSSEDEKTTSSPSPSPTSETADETTTQETTSSKTSSNTPKPTNTSGMSKQITTSTSVDNGRTIVVTMTSIVNGTEPTNATDNNKNNDNQGGLSNTNKIVVGVVVGVGGSILLGLLGVFFYLKRRNNRDYKNGGWTFWRKNEKVGSDEFFNGELGVRDRNINQGSNF